MPRVYGATTACDGCESIKWNHIGECQLCERPGCSQCMEVRYLLKCGSHWTGMIDKRFPELRAVSVDFEHATRFDSEAEALTMKAQLELQPYHGIETVVTVLVCERCRQERAA